MLSEQVSKDNLQRLRCHGECGNPEPVHEAQVKTSKNIINKETVLNSWEGMKQFGGIRTAGCIRCPSGAACLGGSSQHRWSCWFQRCEFCFDSISFLFPNPSSFFLFFSLSLFHIFLHVSCDTQTGAYCKGTMIEPNRPRPSATNIARFYICRDFSIKPT